MKYLNLFYIFFLSVLLTACGGGGGGGGGTTSTDSDNDGVIDTLDAFPNDPTETVDSDNDGVGDNSDAFPNDPTQTETPIDGEKILGCEDYESITTPIGRLNNGIWNAQAAGSFPYKQCLKSVTENGITRYGWEWEWPETSNAYSFPSVVIGDKPWEVGLNNDDRFPRSIEDTPELFITYDVDIESTGFYNFSSIIWTVNVPELTIPRNLEEIETELFISTNTSPKPFTPAGDKLGEVTIDGYEWEIYGAEDWGDASGVNSNRWKLITYISKVNISKITYDAKKMIADAISRGFIEPDHFIADVELGSEVISKTGEVMINRFSVDLSMPADSIPQP